MRNNTFHPNNCEPHSYPQMNFMLDGRKLFDNLKLVAALEDLSAVVPMVGFPFNESYAHERSKEDNFRKSRHYRIKMDKLSNDTILEICDFVALDYCFLDFEPPAICESLIKEICDDGKI